MSAAEAATTPYCRAGHTADPLRLPGAPRGTTTAARRWRDLVRGYANLIGPERLRRPDVRARLSALVSLQLLLERSEAQVARGDPIDHNVLVQGAQQLTKLLDELGLSSTPPGDAASPDVLSYLVASRSAVQPEERCRSAAPLGSDPATGPADRLSAAGPADAEEEPAP